MKSHIFSTLMKDIAKNRLTRGYIVRNFDKYLYDKLINNNNCHLQAVQERKYYFLRAMLHKAVDNLEKGYFSEDMYRNIVDVLVEKAFLGRAYHRDNLEAFRTEYGMLPPTFIVLSPTQACNLNCPGCYASSDPGKSNTLPFHIVDRIIRETRDKFHSRFVTISGGEPFLYKSDGKTLLDIFEKYDDMFFLVYTNGSLITPEIAHRLKESANVTPAISVEGFEQETDQRRGKGTHKNILKAFGNLRQAGVPFGISVTATSNNADILLGNEFYEEYFDRQGAIYMWQFQLMPIGRSHHAFQQMIPAEKRVQLYRKWEELIMEKEYCVADFWNSGVL
ncbi:MAG: radical SAM protein, partial [Bacteroidota bacterium]